MKKPFLIKYILYLILLVVLASSCDRKSQKGEQISDNVLLQEHYSAHSIRHINRDEPIFVRLNKSVISPEKIGTTPENNPFLLSPRVKGTAIWADMYTIGFYPDEWLKTGNVYRVSFDGKAINYGTEQMPILAFEVETQKQSLEVKDPQITISYRNDKTNLANVEGTVITADIADTSKIKQVLNAHYDGKTQNISWAFGKTSHQFRIEGLQRSEKSKSLKLNWNGRQIDSDEKGETVLTIPSVHDFNVIMTKIASNPSTHLLIYFSQPLEPSQDLTGLINIEDATDIHFTINDNIISATPRNTLKGTKKISVEPGIKSICGKVFDTVYNDNLPFATPNPEIRIVSDGNIIPGSGSMIYPIEAIGLNAVRVNILKIFHNNVHQFLQSNELGGNYQLNRVGRMKYSEIFKLNESESFDPHRWMRYYIDLTSLFEPESGALYTIYISFDKNLSAHNCEDVPEKAEEDDYYSYYYYEEYNEESEGLSSLQRYPRGFRWNERDNPCHISYYNPSRWINNTLLSTDIGITAISGQENKMHIFVTGLTNAKPRSGVTITAYDYQNQIINESTTNRDGEAQLKTGRDVFLIKAKQGNDIGYLKIGFNSRLNTSNFETGGGSRQKGVKGFIYSERDVRRPGDTIFAGFMLEDRYNQIPAGHPIIISLSDPRGNEISRKIHHRNPDSEHYMFRFTTSADAPTGNWLLRVDAGHAQFRKYMRIETILPNRIDMELTFQNNEILLWDRSSIGTLKAEWLHGEAARELDTRIEATINQKAHSFENFKDYRFDNPAGYFGPVKQTVFEGKLDSRGRIGFRPDFNINNAPGILNTRFDVRVFEPGGGFSRQSFNFTLHPYNAYVGIKAPKPEGNRRFLETGKKLDFELALVNHNGNPVNSGSLYVTVFEMGWRWWWDRSGENLRQYTQGGNATSKHFEQVTINSGKGTFNYTIPEGEHGRYFIRVCEPGSGHCTGEIVYIGRPSLSHIGRTTQAEGLQWIGLVTDKEEYKTGETVTVNIPIETPSNVLIVLKHGNEIISREWKNSTDGNDITYSFKALPEMTPNIYVHASVFQPHEYTYNNVPARMYGLVPVIIYDPETRLEPVIDIAGQIRPQTKTSFSVSEKNHKPMQYTIAIVDEGLLNLTGFRTPDPWNSFYAKEALSITSWDMYDLVMSSSGSNLRGLLRAGGGLEAEDIGTPDITERFKPVVKVMGPYNLRKGQKQQHSLELPQYIGRVRAMVIASGDKAYGSVHENVTVRAPLMVTATLPRLIRPGESFKMPVHIWAYDHATGNIEINLETNRMFAIKGNKTQRVNITTEGRETIYYEVTAIEEEGMGNIIITATGGVEREVFTSELNSENIDIPVKKHVRFLLESDASWEKTISAFGIKGTNEAWLEISPVKPLNLSNRLDYLLRYPHGCLEQTVSAAFPQLYLERLITLDEKQKAESERNIRNAINRINNFQTSSGGLALWPGSSRPDEWTSIYTAHFLIEAKKQGYSIPDPILNSLIRYIRSAANNIYLGNHANQFVCSYMLYVLALSGEPEWGPMNRLRNRTDINSEVKWRLAAAYQLAGRNDAAFALSRDAEIYDLNNTSYELTFGSRTRNLAMILETLSLLGDRNKGLELFEHITNEFSNENRWMSTQTTAYSLIALSAFYGDMMQKPLNAKVLIDGSEYLINKGKGFARKEINMESGKRVSINVENLGEGNLHVQLMKQGIPIPKDNFPEPFQNNLILSVNYINSNGAPINPARVMRGEDLTVEVSVRYTGYEYSLNNIALSTIFPSGWEIHGMRLHDNDHDRESNFIYRDIRDDRVYTYFGLQRNETKTFRIPINAAYSGNFYLPGVHVEAMYDGNINAVSSGRWIKVIDP